MNTNLPQVTGTSLGQMNEHTDPTAAAEPSVSMRAAFERFQEAALAGDAAFDSAAVRSSANMHRTCSRCWMDSIPDGTR